MSADTNHGTDTNTADNSEDENEYRKIPYMLISTAKVTMEQAMELAKLESKRSTKENSICYFDYMNYVKNQVLV